jgi:hypothetical protein
MKVVKYILTGKLSIGGKEIQIDRKFREMRNAKQYVKSLRNLGLTCSELKEQGEYMVTECRSKVGEGTLELRRQRIAKPKEKK